VPRSILPPAPRSSAPAAWGAAFAAATASATAAAVSDRTASLVIRNLVFTAVVPGLGGAWLPWRILTHDGRTAAPQAWEAVAVIVPGIALYAWCVWNFGAAGHSTPGPWDAPKSVVAASPYRWVRNPIYIAALLIVLGEARLFMSPRLLAYAAAMALVFHLFVTCYEEPVLRRRFGSAYRDYRRAVPRWLLRPPRPA
jgi:protein-S-isoprenylcysteine O-methyltransferase Ste14